MPFLLLFIFGTVDIGDILIKHQYAQHEMYYYLQRMRVEGILTTSDQNQLLQGFQNIGCPVVSLNGTYPAQSQGQSNIAMDPQNVNGSEVTLLITCTPDPQPFWTSRFLGGTPGSYKIKVGGSMLSEYVSP